MPLKDYATACKGRSRFDFRRRLLTFKKKLLMRASILPLCLAALLFSCKDEKAKTEEPKVAAASTEAAPAATPQPDSATMMKNWEAYMTPSEAHKQMAQWTGEWSGDITMWMSPGAPPVKSTGTASNKMILGGRYQQSVNKGSFNGMPFEGVSTLAYDNAKKVYIATWIDNMGTGVMSLEGRWDEASKSVNFTGKCVDPMTGKEMDVRETFKPVDNNFQIMEMYCQGPDGKEYKTMEIKYTRKK